MNILLVIRGGYSLDDDNNVFLSDGTKAIYKDILVLELGKNLKNQHDVKVSTLVNIAEKKDPINFLNQYDLVIKFSLRDTFIHTTKGCVFKNSNAKILFFESPVLERNPFKKLKYQKYVRVMINENFGNNNFIKKYYTNSSRFENLNIKLKSWTKSKGKILIINQLAGDSAIDPINPYDWLEDSIIKIRKITSKKILIRDHPQQLENDKKNMKNILKKYDVNLSKNKKIEDDLIKSEVCVTFSSGSAIDSLIAGVPVIATDKRSFAYEICENKLENILKINKQDRTKLLGAMANIHWELKEIQNMKFWEFFFQLLFKK